MKKRVIGRQTTTKPIPDRHLTFCFKVNNYELIFTRTYGMFGAHTKARFTGTVIQSFFMYGE